MNVTRVCELAAVLVACRHEDKDTIAIDMSGTMRWCMRCGALRGHTAGRWLPSLISDDLEKYLVDETPTTTDVDPRQIPLPLVMRRRRGV